MKLSLGWLSWQHHKKCQMKSKGTVSSPEGHLGAQEQVLVGTGGPGELPWGPGPLLGVQSSAGVELHHWG